MEGKIYQDGSLLDKTEVDAQVFDLPLDLFAEVGTPNLIILQINVSNQLVIQVKMMLIIVFVSDVSLTEEELLLRIRKSIRHCFELRLYLLEHRISRRYWVCEEGYLLLHVIVESLPHVDVIIGTWELPEDLLDRLDEQGVSEVEDVHTNQEEVEEVNE